MSSDINERKSFSDLRLKGHHLSPGQLPCRLHLTTVFDDCKIRKLYDKLKCAIYHKLYSRASEPVLTTPTSRTSVEQVLRLAITYANGAVLSARELPRKLVDL